MRQADGGGPWIRWLSNDTRDGSCCLCRVEEAHPFVVFLKHSLNCVSLSYLLCSSFISLYLDLAGIKRWETGIVIKQEHQIIQPTAE
jgi:hypothetical protein